MATQQLFSFLADSSPKSAPTKSTGESKKKSPAPVPNPSSVPKPSPAPSDASETAADHLAAPPNRETVLRQLRNKVGCISTPRKSDLPVFSTGCAEMDAWLPLGGLSPLALTDWVAAHDSTAAGSLAMLAAANRLVQIPDRPLVIVDCEGSFYPPAAVALGVPAERMVLLRPSNGADALWAIDQSLRSGAVAGVWATLPMRVDDRDARRLQLAAETGRTPGLLVRGFHDRGRPGFSEVQFYVTEKKRRRLKNHPTGSSAIASSQTITARNDFETLCVTLDRVRGGVVGRQIEVMIDDQAHLRALSSNRNSRHESAAKHLASQLAHPTAIQRTSSATKAAQRAG